MTMYSSQGKWQNLKPFLGKEKNNTANTHFYSENNKGKNGIAKTKFCSENK